MTSQAYSDRVLAFVDGVQNASISVQFKEAARALLLYTSSSEADVDKALRDDLKLFALRSTEAWIEFNKLNMFCEANGVAAYLTLALVSLELIKRNADELTKPDGPKVYFLGDRKSIYSLLWNLEITLLQKHAPGCDVRNFHTQAHLELEALKQPHFDDLMSMNFDFASGKLWEDWNSKCRDYVPGVEPDPATKELMRTLFNRLKTALHPEP
jgi:hypothetical protein